MTAPSTLPPRPDRMAGTALPPLLVVEDDARIGPMLESMLEDTYAVTRAVDAAGALRLATERDFVAVVLDRRLPDGDGLDVVRRLRTQGSDVPILVLTALGSLDDRVGGLDAGADDYLVKPFASVELAARLRAITREHSDRDGSLMIGEWEFRPATRIIHSPYSGRAVLTRGESELLHLLARHPDQTLSRERILREVFSMDDTPGTVDTAVHHLRRKTDHDIVTTVRGRGYRIGRL